MADPVVIEAPPAWIRTMERDTTVPSHATLEAAASALASSRNRVQELVMQLERVANADEARVTLKTLGSVGVFTDSVRTSVQELSAYAQRLSSVLVELDAMRTEQEQDWQNVKRHNR
jgi:hypothetical protein